MRQTLLTLALGLLICFSSFSQGFYDLNTVQTIEITFEQSNWDALMDAQKSGDEDYIMAKSISINGVVLDSIGVKYKGNSTYSANQTKNPLHIELDTYKNQDYESYTDIKLSNVANDPSFVREVLSYHILQQYMDAPLSNYANVYINGSLIGLYSNSESISKSFVKEHFFSKKNTFVKCNPPAGAGPTSTNLPKLNYLGEDSASYYTAYELKSDAGWNELIDLCDTLENHSDHIETILDTDRALWMHAFNNVLVNLDSYSGKFAQNYYLYRNKNGHFIPILWDFNESFGRFSQTGESNLNSTTAKAQMNHLLLATNNDYPLISQLLSNDTYKRMYFAHMKTILLENFDNDYYYTVGQTLQTLIDADVQADQNKFFTYANFTSNLDSDISGGRGPQATTTPGIKSLMAARNTYLMGLSVFTATAPEVSDITLSDETPVIDETISISATITTVNTAYLAYRSDIEDAFTKVEMQKTNNTFSADITVKNAYTQYYIYAENDDAGIFSPQRAAHEYYSFTATVTETEVSDIVINEFMASNTSTLADQDGEYDDWIELYNNSSESVDISGYYLSDDAEDLKEWALPEGTILDGNSYLIIWADKDEEQTGLHADFKLSSTSESIFLTDTTRGVIDEVSYINQSTDISYGRMANGTGSFTSMSPTPNAENSITANLENDNTTKKMELSAFPNPSSNNINLVVPNSMIGEDISVYSLTGGLIYTAKSEASQSIDVSNWNTGMYLIRVNTLTTKVIVE